jgi:hypothetical protein
MAHQRIGQVHQFIGYAGSGHDISRKNKKWNCQEGNGIDASEHSYNNYTERDFHNKNEKKPSEDGRDKNRKTGENKNYQYGKNH